MHFMNLSVLLHQEKQATVLRLTKFMCCPFFNFMIFGAVLTARHETTQPHNHHDRFLHTIMAGKFIEPNLNCRGFLRVCYDATLRANCNLFAGTTCSSCVPKGQGHGGEDEGEIVTCCVKRWKKFEIETMVVFCNTNKYWKAVVADMYGAQTYQH